MEDFAGAGFVLHASFQSILCAIFSYAGPALFLHHFFISYLYKNLNYSVLANFIKAFKLMLYKLIFFISVVSLLAFYSCVYPNTDCVKDIKHVETCEFEDPIQRTDYYYVYDFDYDDECYEKVAAFAKNIKLDTTKDHIIEFLRYDKYLPDSSKIKKVYLVDGKYNDYHILRYVYRKKNKSIRFIYSKGNRIIKIVKVKN